MTLHMSSLVLEHFRNYDYASLDLSPGVNILIGDNAQGKTNVLEAAFLVSTGRSFRTSVDSDLIKWDAEMSTVSASVNTRFSNFDAEVRLHKTAPKTIKLGGNLQRKRSEYVGTIPVVVFSPDNLELAKGAPSCRRRFLDLLLSQSDKVYCRNISLYAKILQQRNAALRITRDSRRALSDLEPWTEQLVSVGSRIICDRINLLPTLSEFAQRILTDITGGVERLSLVYLPSLILNGDVTIDGIIDSLNKEINARLPEEVRRAVTLVGPHRDDFSMKVNGFDIRTFGSQGQQRSVVLALKIAEMEHMKVVKGEYPLVLLDDVMSELDFHRQSSLLYNISNEVQAIMTTTDLAAIGDKVPTDSRLFAVSEGKLKMC